MATLTLVGGVAAGPATWTANAATPSCGPTCIDIFSKDFGTHPNPQFVLDVLRQGEKVGQPIILFRAANSDPAEDFTISSRGACQRLLPGRSRRPRRWTCTTACGYNIATGMCSGHQPGDGPAIPG